MHMPRTPRWAHVLVAMLVCAVMAACGTTDKVLDNQHKQIELVARGGDAATNPVNLDPKTMIAMPGSTGNDIEDYSTDVQERAHNPVAGDVFSAALVGGMNSVVTPENSVALESIRADIRMFRALWLAEAQKDAADATKLAQYRELWDAAKAEAITYEAKLQQDAKDRASAVTASMPPGMQSYQYMPTKVVIIGPSKGSTSETSLTAVARIISSKRGEEFEGSGEGEIEETEEGDESR